VGSSNLEKKMPQKGQSIAPSKRSFPQRGQLGVSDASVMFLILGSRRTIRVRCLASLFVLLSLSRGELDGTIAGRGYSGRTPIARSWVPNTTRTIIRGMKILQTATLVLLMATTLGAQEGAARTET